MSDALDAVAFRLLSMGRATSAGQAQEMALDYLTAHRAADVSIKGYRKKLAELMQMGNCPARANLYRELVEEFAAREQAKFNLDPEVRPFADYT